MQMTVTLSHSFADATLAAQFMARCKAIFDELMQSDTAAHAKTATTTHNPIMGGTVPRMPLVTPPAATPVRPEAPIPPAPIVPAAEVQPTRGAVWGAPPAVPTGDIGIGAAPPAIQTTDDKPKRRRATKAEMEARRAQQSGVVPPPTPRADAIKAAPQPQVLDARNAMTQAFSAIVALPDGLTHLSALLTRLGLTHFGAVTDGDVPRVSEAMQQLHAQLVRGDAPAIDNSNSEDW